MSFWDNVWHAVVNFFTQPAVSPQPTDSCFTKCLKQIPWGVWLILVAAGIIFALITVFTGGIGAIAGVTIPLWIQAVLVGLGPTGTTILNCLRGCSSNNSSSSL